MNSLHVHLFINHLPIAGTILGALITGMPTGSHCSIKALICRS